MTGEQRPKLVVTRVGGIERIHVERADGDMLAAPSVVQDQYAHVGQLLTCRFFPTIYLHTMSRVRGRLSWIHVSFYWKHVKYTVSYRIVSSFMSPPAPVVFKTSAIHYYRKKWTTMAYCL